MSDFSLSPSADGVGLAPVFFRTADRLRLEGCVAGLLRDGRSLAMSSTREAALDHYSRLLFARLRESSPQSQLEVYFPADTAAMLARFNDALAEQSVKQAMQTAGAEVAARIMIVHDAGALADHEVQLLASLVQNFPGANIRIVLLLGTSSRSRKIFESFDRRMLRWDIETPSPEQAEAMLAQGREDGCEGVVKALLKKMNDPAPSDLGAGDPAGIDPLGFAAAGASPATKEVFTFSGGSGKGRAERQSAKTDKAAKNSQQRSGAGLLRWLLVVGGLAVLSVGITAWLHPDVFALDRLQMAKRWATDAVLGKPKTVAPAEVAAVAIAPVAPAAESSQTLAAVPAQADASAVAAVTAGTASADTPAQVPVTAAPTVEPAPQASVSPATPVTPASPITSATPAKPGTAAKPAKPATAVAPSATAADSVAVEPPAEALAGQAWLKPMPAGTFVVQHAAMPSYQAAQDWQKSIPALSSARIVALYRPNQKMAYFVVVSGPFANRVLATEAAQARGAEAAAWVRSARSLREQFTPEQANARKKQETR